MEPAVFLISEPQQRRCKCRRDGEHQSGVADTATSDSVASTLDRASDVVHSFGARFGLPQHAFAQYFAIASVRQDEHGAIILHMPADPRNSAPLPSTRTAERYSANLFRLAPN